MKLYYLFISFFCYRVIGLFNCLMAGFLYLFINHIESRVSFYKFKYKDNFFVNKLDKFFEIKNNLLKKNNKTNFLDKIYSSKIYKFLHKYYLFAEEYYLIFIGEILLMFTNLISSLIGTLLFSPLKNNETFQFNEKEFMLQNEKEFMVQPEKELILKNNNNDLLTLLKKENNISKIKEDESDKILDEVLDKEFPSFFGEMMKDGQFGEMMKDSQFGKMDLNDLNNMNQNLLSMKGMLGNLVNEMNKEKTL